MIGGAGTITGTLGAGNGKITGCPCAPHCGQGGTVIAILGGGCAGKGIRIEILGHGQGGGAGGGGGGGTGIPPIGGGLITTGTVGCGMPPGGIGNVGVTPPPDGVVGHGCAPAL